LDIERTNYISLACHCHSW